MPDTYPDARIVVAVETKDHNLQTGIKQLNPILKGILEGLTSPPRTPGDLVSEKFGRLTFSQTGK
jgi:hypothetical protein